MKYFVCVSTQFESSNGFASFIIEHDGLITTRIDIERLTQNAEKAYNQQPDCRKDYTSFMLVSYTRMDEVRSTQISGGMMLL
jgi:hypothetical protein